MSLMPSDFLVGDFRYWQRKVVHVRSRAILENMGDKNTEKNVDNRCMAYEVTEGNEGAIIKKG